MSDKDNIYVGEISAPIMQVLMAGTHLFFPKNTIRAIRMGNYMSGTPTLTLKNSEMTTIDQARKFRDKLSIFLIDNKEEIQTLAKEFAEAKHKAGIGADEELGKYKTEHLHTHFDQINTKIHGFRSKLRADLGFNELFVNE